LRLSKKADYALMAMKHLALRGDQGSSSAREIAALYDIPIELMAKVLQRLVRRGLLASHQGTRGGYELVRRPTQISVADVIELPQELFQSIGETAGPVATRGRDRRPSVQRGQRQTRILPMDHGWRVVSGRKWTEST